MNAQHPDQICWKDLDQQLAEAAERTRSIEGDPDAEQVKSSLNELFAELKTLSQTAQEISRILHKD